MRPLITLLALALLAACADDPSASHLGGVGDPVRGAALYAPRNFGDTSRWARRPAEAAVAAEQIEFLTEELQTNPRYAPQISAGTLHALQLARAEMRAAVGIAENAEPRPVILALRNAAAALREGSQLQAMAALSTPAFPAGPDATLRRLSTLPRLPRAAEAAGMVASEIDRMDRIRR